MTTVRKRQGFTLIELLVVVVIIGILASVSVGAFRDAQDRARNSSVISLTRAVQMGVEQWKTDYSGLPIELTKSGANDPTKYLCADNAADAVNWPVKYTPGAQVPKTPWCNVNQGDIDGNYPYNNQGVSPSGVDPADNSHLVPTFFNNPNLQIDSARDPTFKTVWSDGGEVGGKVPSPTLGPKVRQDYGYMFMMTDPPSGRYLVCGAGKFHGGAYLVAIKANF